MYGMNSVSPLSSQIQGSHVISANATTGPRGLFNITSTPLTTVHQIAAPSDIMGMPLPADEPRTKSERSTKVYIGKIPNGLSDYFMEQLFLECGQINSWRRILDSSGKPLTFGFVEFTYVEGMLRCLRLMNNLQIQGSKLVCRVDTQTEFFIKEWSDLKRADWERKRWDNIMDKNDVIGPKTWEDEVVKEDVRVQNNVKNIIFKFEQHAGQDPEEREDEKEHPREKEREKRLRALYRDRDRVFKEKEKEWIKREELKEREREKEKEKVDDRERERIRMLRRDEEYLSSDDENLKKKFSKKFEKIRNERLKFREKEKEEDVLNSRKEFESLFPGVATADERQKQMEEIERKKKENEDEYELKDHQDLLITVSVKETKNIEKPLTSFTVSQDLDEEDPLFNRRHKPLSLPLFFEEAPKEVPQSPEITMNEESFNNKLKLFKSLLDKVPKRKNDLYAYSLSWNALAQNRIIEKKLGPFISKLFIEYVGQDDRNLVQLVTRMVVNRDNPEKIQSTVEKFLDVDAEVLVR
jgi:RNA recognition motif-containing protein